MEEIKNKAEKLSETETEKVSGGYVHHRPGMPSFEYVVVDDRDGDVVGRYKTKEEAQEAAKNWKLSSKVLTDEEYFDLQLTGELGKAASRMGNKI